jgi:signal transduction histidine kinase
MRLPRVPWSLRTQVTIGAALVVMVVVGLAGLVIGLQIYHQNLGQVDQDLKARAAQVGNDANRLLANDHMGGYPNGPGDVGNLLAGTQTLLRVLSGNQVILERGQVPAAKLPLPVHDGLTTIQVGDEQWRSLAQQISDGQLQVLENLGPVQQRLHQDEQLIAMIAATATLLTALGVWVVTGIVVAPLRRLRAGALTIRPGRDVDQRLPQVRRPQEVAELSATLNAMLERLQGSMQATRRFTADAGHELRTPLTSLGMDLETLRRNPELPADQRADTLAAMAVEHARIVSLLEGLQALARGDAGALPAAAASDVAELVDEAVVRARRRHPDVTYRVHNELPGGVVVGGWPDGLRRAVDNLLDNAALHGRPAGVVEVRLFVPADRFVGIAIGDDGPGIPAELRDAMRQRFARGPSPRGDGSGLGLALVEQQAVLHGGSLTLGEAAGGGLEATMTLSTRS